MKQHKLARALALALVTALGLLTLAGCAAGSQEVPAADQTVPVSSTPIPAPVLVPTPTPTPTPEPAGVLADYAGTYTAYPSSRSAYYELGDITLDENGVITGGQSYFSHNTTPASVTCQDDGSIRVVFTEDEFYTVYPPGVTPAPQSSDADTSVANLAYYYCDGGVMMPLYHKK